MTLTDTDVAADIQGEALPWHQKAMRWAQLTLVDDDPREGSGYDTQFWLDYIRDIRADAACLSAGGYMAFYPTQVEGHYRSIHLGDSDPFGDLVRGCREQGLVVMARIDPHAIHDSIARNHPEWVAVDFDGKPIPHWAAPDLWLTCPIGTYSTEFIPKVNAEILENYDVDSIFANRWTGTGRCYCPVCKASFLDATGFDIPRELDAAHSPKVLPPIEKAFRDWREAALLAIARLWDDGIRAINPDARFVPNSGGGPLSDLDMTKLAAQTETLFADKQARSGFGAPWVNGLHAKEFTAVMGTKAIGGIFSVGIEESPRWKDSVQSGAEIDMWVASATANGMRPWFTKFGGTIPDSRWLPVVRDIFHWHADNERYLRNESPIADVGVVYSQQTAKMYGLAESLHSVEGAMLGIYGALVESRVPFTMVHDRNLDPAELAGLKVLILPNIASLSDAQCAQLRAFVAGGGSLVASYQTSLFDENGNARENFGLADLFGVTYAGEVRTEVHNSYLQLHPAADDRELPILEGIGDTTRIINAVNFVAVTPSSAASAPITLIDSYPDLPMEEVYRRDWSVGVGQLSLQSYGKGRVAYFPGDLDRSYHDYSTEDHRLVLMNTVRWARNSAPLIEVSGPGIVEVTGWTQADSLTVHLVNYNNAHYWKAPFTELIASPPYSVRIALPAGRTIAGARLLRSGAPVALDVRDGSLFVEVPSISDFEVVAIDFAS
jgi:hypothetical protein